MFVVFGAVRMYKAYGSDIAHGWLWYLPVVGLCWLLGWMVARWFSIPSDRALRARLLEPVAQHDVAIANAARVGETG
jgi:hypothetical protein